MNWTIRRKKPTDQKEILDLNLKAFQEEGSEIAELLQDLEKDTSAEPRLELVAEAENRLIGHILFTKASLEDFPEAEVRILAPMAVMPSIQKKGLGQKLIREGLEILQNQGVELVFVLGHVGFYPKAGFVPAGLENFPPTRPIPQEHAPAWMVQELKPGKIKKYSGKVLSCSTLSQERYW